MKKYLLTLVSLLTLFASSELQAQTKKATYIYHSGNNFDIFACSEIDSITYEGDNENIKQVIWTKDGASKILVSSIDSVGFNPQQRIYEAKNYNGWDDVRFNMADNTCAYIKEKGNGDISELLSFVPLNEDSVITCYLKFDEDAILPSVISLDDVMIFPKRISDNYINATIVIHDSLYISLDSIECPNNYDSRYRNYHIRRAWGENNAFRNTCATIATITGAIGITLGVIALLPEEVAAATMIAAAMGIAAGTTAIMDGVSKLLVPADSPYNLSQGNAATIESMTFDGIGNFLNPSITGGVNSGAGAIASILDMIFGKTVSHSDRVKLIESGIVTGLSKDVTSHSAIVRGYINPIIFVDPLRGNVVDHYYGIMVQSTSSNNTPTQGSFEGLLDKREENGRGGLIEYSFDHLDAETEYEYFTYYRDKTNGISVCAPSKYFTTKSVPVELTDFNVTKAEWKRSGYEYNGKTYTFKYNCSVTATLTDATNVKDWGYCYVDPNGDYVLISLKDKGTSYTDDRYAYCRNEPEASVILYGYVWYNGEDNPQYAEGWEYPLVYNEEPSITYQSAEILDVSGEPQYDGDGSYLFTWYTARFKYVIKITGGYWIDNIQPMVYDNGSWSYNGGKARVPGDGLYSVTTSMYYDNTSNMNWSTGYNITLNDGTTMYSSNTLQIGGTPESPTISVGGSASRAAISRKRIKQTEGKHNIPTFGELIIEEY